LGRWLTWWSSRSFPAYDSIYEVKRRELGLLSLEKAGGEKVKGRCSYCPQLRPPYERAEPDSRWSYTRKREGTTDTNYSKKNSDIRVFFWLVGFGIFLVGGVFVWWLFFFFFTRRLIKHCVRCLERLWDLHPWI